MNFLRLLMIMTVAGAVAHTSAWGQEVAPAPAPEQKAFETKLSLGATLTDGNSETMQVNGSLITEGEKKGLGSVRAGIEANYGETTTKTINEAGVVTENSDTTIKNANLFVGAKKTITELTFWSINASTLYDDIAEIDYRATLAPGLGFYLVKNDTASLSIEAGPAYIWEKVSGVTDNYLALRLGERFDYAFSDTAKVWQSAEYLPKADDFGDYLLNVEVGAEAALNSTMSLRLVLQNKHDSTPGAGLEKNDLVLIGGLGVKL